MDPSDPRCLRRTRRVALGISQLNLALEIGVREETIRRWETGRARPHRVIEQAWEQALTRAEAAA